MIITKTPLRISFTGGGSDLRAYYQHGAGAVVSTAIDKYVYVILHKRFDDLIRVGYSKAELVEQIDQVEHDIIREALRLTGVDRGVEILYFADIQIGKAGTGLGSSSSLAVGILNALHTYRGETVTPEQLAEEACQIEITTLGRPIGKQDQYIAAHGGCNFMQFHPDESVTVEPLSLSPEVQGALNQNLLLFYTGLATGSSEVLGQQQERTPINRDFLDRMVSLAHETKTTLVNKQHQRLGELLHQNWLHKKQLADKISNNHIDEHYDKARQAGASGGKIVGSGGGGFLLLYVEPERCDQVREALAYLRELSFTLEGEGSKLIWRD